MPFVLNLALLVLLYFSYCRGRSFQDGLFGVLWDSFFGRFCEFYTGIYLALLARRCGGRLQPGWTGREVRQRENAGMTMRGTKKWTLIGLAGIAILFLPLIYVTNKSTGLRLLVMLVVNNFLLPVAIAVLYFGLIFESSLLRRWLSSGAMRLAGRSSYAFFLLTRGAFGVAVH